MKRFNDVRKIKIISDIVKETKTTLLPNDLDILDNNFNYSIYPTQFFLNDNKIETFINANNKQLVKSSRTKSEHMEIPDLSLPLTDILNIYEVDTIEELVNLIKKLIYEDNTEFTIYRLVNTYTRIFYDDLKKTNNSLIKIFKIIFENTHSSKSDNKDKKAINISDELSKFLKKWFEKNNKDDFDLNICKDVKYFLSNKYE